MIESNSLSLSLLTRNISLLNSETLYKIYSILVSQFPSHEGNDQWLSTYQSSISLVFLKLWLQVFPSNTKNIQMDFIWPIDETLTGTTILGQSGPGMNANKFITSQNCWRSFR